MADSDQPEPSVRALIGQLGADARAFARAEAAYVRAELGARASLLVPALIMIAVAGVLGLCALIALVLGLLLALAPYAGMLGATALISALAILVAFILYRLSAARFRSAFQKSDEL
jgi:hypothetical protein